MKVILKTCPSRVQIRNASDSRVFQGLVPVAGADTSIPVLENVQLRRLKRVSSSNSRDYVDRTLGVTTDAVREMVEFDLDDGWNPIQTRDEEARLESLSLYNDLYGTDESSGENLRRSQAEEWVMQLHQRMPNKNPFGDVKILRSISNGDFSGEPSQLSVDVSPKRFRELLNDYEGKRCHLCDEAYQAWHIHQGFIPHSAREAIALELLRPFCGTPTEINSMWWWRLHHSKRFRRIRSLSHATCSKSRRRQLFFLLKFLKEKGVIRETFNVNRFTTAQSVPGGGPVSTLGVSSGRSWEFERLEFLGDNVVKYLFNDRLNVLFPVHEGGIRGSKLAYSQFMIDGNDGLARAYDFLDFQKLTESDRVVSKFKSDVMETLFGELQLYLWATEVDNDTCLDQHTFPLTPEFLPLRAVVRHVMEELGHVMLMYHIDYVCAVVNQTIQKENLKLIRADPALRNNIELQQQLASTAYSARLSASQRRLVNVPVFEGGRKKHGTGERVPFPVHDTHLLSEEFHASMWAAVAPLGGLLPRPFHRHELRFTHNFAFMPHLTAATATNETGDNTQCPAIISDARRAGKASFVQAVEESSDAPPLSPTRMPEENGEPSEGITVKWPNADAIREIVAFS